MTVLGMSSEAKGIWRSNLEKIDEPATLDVKSVMLGNGYLLGLVRLFNQR